MQAISNMVKRFVIVRTNTAGVHTGYLQASLGTVVVLSEGRRIHYWTEANTLHEIALRGCGQASRISEPVEQIALTEAIEIIPCTADAEANLRRSRWN